MCRYYRIEERGPFAQYYNMQNNTEIEELVHSLSSLNEPILSLSQSLASQTRYHHSRHVCYSAIRTHSNGTWTTEHWCSYVPLDLVLVLETFKNFIFKCTRLACFADCGDCTVDNWRHSSLACLQMLHSNRRKRQALSFISNRSVISFFRRERSHPSITPSFTLSSSLSSDWLRQGARFIGVKVKLTLELSRHRPPQVIVAFSCGSRLD